jgi:hypothetical protein
VSFYHGGPSGSDDQACSVILPPLEYLDEDEQRRAAKALASREEYQRQQALISEPPSREEFEMLARLHQEQDEAGIVGRRSQDEPYFRGLHANRLVTESWERMYPEKENVPLSIFGGYLIRRAFELSSICAGLVAPDRAIIAAVTRINFFHPVRIGDTLHYTSTLSAWRPASSGLAVIVAPKPFQTPTFSPSSM